MQNKNTSGTAAAVSRPSRGGFYFKKIAKEVALRIGFVIFCWFVFQYALGA